MKYKAYLDYVNKCGIIVSDDGMVTIVDPRQNVWSPTLIAEFDNEIKAILRVDEELAKRKKARRA